MDALLSAVASDLMSRLVSFLIGKYQVGSGAADATDTAVRLQRALLRARVVVEEAEGRQITNRAMLQQLNQLRQELCRAAYALDAVRWRDRRSHLKVRRSRSPHARPLPSSDCSEVLSGMVGSLEAALSDMREFVVLLGTCPRVTKQPYSTYLFMENCMFGRQLEKEQLIGFLLSQPPPSHEDLDVLPIIGPREVGKRTLVEHVCLDDRVRERFAKVHRLRSDELHEHDWGVLDFTARLLVVIDMVDGDTDAEESWKRFHASFHRRARNGSRVIVISRAEAAHASLGTVPPLRLRPLRREELWYLFRALAFGPADPDDRSDLARIAMALCEGIDNLSPFVAANIIAASLRADLSARSWRRVLTVCSAATVLRLGSVSDGLGEEWVGRYCFSPPEKDVHAAPFLFYNRRKSTGVVQRDQLPKVTMLELLAGGSLPPAGETRFDLLVWQSRIPPYASYIASCDMEKARQRHVLADNNKRRLNKRRREQQEGGPSN